MNLKQFFLIFLASYLIVIMATVIFLNVNAANDIKSQDYSPTKSEFFSDTTQNGVRRFLAVGNFYDTTNDNYFRNSKSELTFEINLNEDTILSSLELDLYKYANAYDGSVTVSATINDQITNSVSVNSNDYDFQLLNFNFSGNFSNLSSKDLKISLKVDSPDYKEGIALCSGNFNDNVCLEKYNPKLIVNYKNNKPGELLLLDYSNSEILSSVVNDEFSDCTISKGCNLNHQLHYLDPDSNAVIELEYTNTTNNTKIQKQIQLNAIQDIQFNLPDGKYIRRLIISDGSASKTMDLDEIKIDTTPPPKPMIIFHSDYGSRSGVNFSFDYNNDVDHYSYRICQNIQDSNCQKNIDSGVFTENINIIKTRKPLISDKYYYYIFNSVDDNGNKSSSTIVKLLQKNNLVELNNIKLSHNVISPKNKDNRFDISKIFFEASEKITKFSYRLFDHKGKLIKESNQNFIDGYSNKKYIPDGKYYLVLSIQDMYGYPANVHESIEISIDNTPPKLL